MGRAMSRHFASKQCRNRVSKMTGKHDRSPKKTRLKLVLRMQHNTNLMVSREMTMMFCPPAHNKFWKSRTSCTLFSSQSSLLCGFIEPFSESSTIYMQYVPTQKQIGNDRKAKLGTTQGLENQQKCLILQHLLIAKLALKSPEFVASVEITRIFACVEITRI